MQQTKLAQKRNSVILAASISTGTSSLSWLWDENGLWEGPRDLQSTYMPSVEYAARLPTVEGPKNAQISFIGIICRV